MRIFPDLLRPLSTAASLEAGLDRTLRRIVRFTGADGGLLVFRPPRREPVVVIAKIDSFYISSANGGVSWSAPARAASPRPRSTGLITVRHPRAAAHPHDSSKARSSCCAINSPARPT